MSGRTGLAAPFLDRALRPVDKRGLPPPKAHCGGRWTQAGGGTSVRASPGTDSSRLAETAGKYPYIPRIARWGFLLSWINMAIPPTTRLKPFSRMVDRSQLAPDIVRLAKDGRRLVVEAGLSRAYRDERLYGTIWKRLPVMVRLFALTGESVREAFADLGDASWQAGALSFCSALGDAILVPDRQFFSTDAHRHFRELAAAHAHNWDRRSDVVLWRGNLSGEGVTPANVEACDSDNPALLARIRLCLKLRGVAGADVKVPRGRISRDNPAAAAALDQAGILGDFVRQEEWVNRKFAIDIDGFSNAWVNFYVRLVLGCCVIKVASGNGYRQWYYGDLVPWRHYVPVASDMSDLVEKVEWCRTHDREARAIGEAGQAFALSHTVASETVAAVRRIEAALG